MTSVALKNSSEDARAMAGGRWLLGHSLWIGIILVAGLVRFVGLNHLDVGIDEARWPEFVQAATLDAMRARASDTAPDAHLGLWQSAEGFFRQGGSREWQALLAPDDVAHFDERLHDLAGDSAEWVTSGRSALD
jgi:hypothetical protein